MNIEEASAIVSRYQNSIKDLRPNGYALLRDDLEDVTGLIKYAHYVLGEHFIDNDNLSLDVAKELTESFSLIDTLFVDDPDRLNLEYSHFINALRDNKIIDYKIPNPFGDSAAYLEFYNFLGSLAFDQGKENPLIDPSGKTFEAAIFSKYYELAIAEHSIENIKLLVNIGVTVHVKYPGRKKRTVI